MDAPDKIYIFKGDAIKLVVEQPNNVEYIRKDALLGWAKPRISGLYFRREDSFRCGYEQAVKEFIDKINSL